MQPVPLEVTDFLQGNLTASERDQAQAIRQQAEWRRVASEDERDDENEDEDEHEDDDDDDDEHIRTMTMTKTRTIVRDVRCHLHGFG